MRLRQDRIALGRRNRIDWNGCGRTRTGDSNREGMKREGWGRKYGNNNKN